MPEFQEFNKIARLSRNAIITEKINGTNAQVHVLEDGTVLAGSRNRYITPESDHFGFAKWVKEHEDELRGLGEGRHFGEWWGSGIQGGYGLKNGEKRFSLFNVAKWGDDAVRPKCCHVVPVLYSGLFTTEAVIECLDNLAKSGSVASPGFMDPEGVVIYHEAARTLFKKTLKKDEVPKSLAA